jgi:uncharacterized membrane protein YbhN (UPF0104 family)
MTGLAPAARGIRIRSRRRGRSGRLRRVALVAQVLAIPGLVALAALAAPGLLHHLEGGDAGWLVLAGALELVSCLAFVVLFGTVFGRGAGLHRALRLQIASAELAAGVLFPAGSLGGAALGAWALRRGGLSAQRVATGSVAFVILQNTAFVGGTAALGAAVLLGAVPVDAPLGLVLPPLLVALAVIGAVLLVAWRGARWAEGRARWRRWLGPVVAGLREALGLLRRQRVLVASTLYAAADLGALWAALQAFGRHPAPGALLLAYLLGQSASAIPLPGGIGAVDAGLIGALALLGLGGAAVVSAVLAYRALALGLPTLWGGIGYLTLQRTLARAGRARPGARTAREVGGCAA